MWHSRCMEYSEGLAKSNVLGGAANEQGSQFRASIAAWVMAHAAVGRALPLSSLRQERAIPIAVRMETDNAIDDIEVQFVQGNRALIQVKRTLTLSSNPESSFGKAVAQWVRQAEEGLRVDDRILLVCNHASRPVSALQSALQRFGDVSSGNMSAPEARALAGLDHHLIGLDNLRKVQILSRAEILILKVDTAGVADAGVAAELLAGRVVESRDGRRAFEVLKSLVQAASSLRSGLDIPRMHDAFCEAGFKIPTPPPISPTSEYVTDMLLKRSIMVSLPVKRYVYRGRADTLLNALDLIQRGVSLLQVTGASGIGKTRLALEVAERVANSQKVLALHGPDFAASLRNLLEAFGMPTLEAHLNPEIDLDRFLRAIRRTLGLEHQPMLFILDGAERPVNIGAFTRDGASTVLVTSQTPKPGLEELSLLPLELAHLEHLVREAVGGQISALTELEVSRIARGAAGSPRRAEWLVDLVCASNATQVLESVGLAHIADRAHLQTLRDESNRLLGRVYEEVGAEVLRVLVFLPELLDADHLMVATGISRPEAARIQGLLLETGVLTAATEGLHFHEVVRRQVTIGLESDSVYSFRNKDEVVVGLLRRLATAIEDICTWDESAPIRAILWDLARWVDLQTDIFMRELSQVLGALGFLALSEANQRELARITFSLHQSSNLQLLLDEAWGRLPQGTLLRVLEALHVAGFSQVVVTVLRVVKVRNCLNPEGLLLMARALFATGALPEAKSVLERAVAFPTLDRHSRLYLRAEGWLAVVENNLEPNSNGPSHQLSVLFQRRRLFGEWPIDYDVLQGLNDVGVAFWRRDDLKHAEEYLAECVEKRRRYLGVTHGETMRAENNYLEVKREILKANCDSSGLVDLLAKREDLVERVEGILGWSHRETLQCRNNLATLFGDLGRWREAAKEHALILDDRRLLLGELHYETLLSWHNWGASLRHSVDPNDRGIAWKELGNVLEKRKSILGTLHRDVALTLRELVELCVDGMHPEMRSSFTVALGEASSSAFVSGSRLRTEIEELIARSDGSAPDAF